MCPTAPVSVFVLIVSLIKKDRKSLKKGFIADICLSAAELVFLTVMTILIWDKAVLTTAAFAVVVNAMVNVRMGVLLKNIPEEKTSEESPVQEKQGP